MASVLLLIVTDLVVKLFEIVFKCDNLVLGGIDRIVERQDILIALLDDLALMAHTTLRSLHLNLHAFDGVPASLIRVVLGLTPLTKFAYLLTLTHVDLLDFT